MDQKQSVENVYMQQVLDEQAEVNRRLKKRSAPSMMAGTPGPRSEAEPDQEQPRHAVDYRITGFGIWQTVVVPPNVYVIHTRRGHKEPIDIGMGISFKFNPRTDAFLIIPSAVQTILINANSICLERQGILVQAYVQWIIDDIKTAYRKLDFSDPVDPMGIVNVQLREQAEAAIKDKVATMSIDEVLSDKQPIIEELTHRLRAVAEGNREGDGDSGGLGLKIVTIQIKEAVVSSTRLWQNLQIPFRAERERIARLAELESKQQIAARELENRLARERSELEAESEMARLRAAEEQARFDTQHTEQLRRHKLEQEGERKSTHEENATLKARNEGQLELALQELELEKRRIAAEIEQIQKQMELDEMQAQKTRALVTGELDVQEMRHVAEAEHVERRIALEKLRHVIANDLSDEFLRARLIEALPEVAKNLPVPQEQRTVITGGEDGTSNVLLNFLASAFGITESFFNKEE